MYRDVQLHINGQWRDAEGGRTIPVLNPATEEVIGTVAHAARGDMDAALDAAAKGFKLWSKVSAYDRAKVMRKAADLLRERAGDIARLMTLEQGKPVAEAKMETLAAADIIDWFAEEARRAYGRVIPSRAPGVYQLVVKEPVGPVAAFTPWNFPINQVVRKLSAALAAGCSIIVKAPEETPASPAELIRTFVDAGVPASVIGLLYGVPAEISEYLIPHPVIRKVTFTGSTPVGKQLSALAGAHMKRITMELGGHSPVIVFDDADVDAAAKQIAAAKFRNAGQVCVSPTRFMVQEKAYDQFVDRFLAHVKTIKVGNGLEEGVNMGPLANERRVPAIEALIADASQKGADVRTGGNRIGNKGYFFEPTVVTGVSREMRMMNEEPFGPLAMIFPFADFDEAVEEANRLPYGLASYAYTRSAKTANAIAASVEAGMMT
ncbi:MAG: NAD-dependent succinate-semialdehyde dehydrogenase, partial [Rhizobiales bacterium 35-68-8]